jgi:hypothetical protein
MSKVNSRLVPVGNFFFRYRNAISPIVFCSLALISRPLIIAGNHRLDMFLDITGIVTALAGQLLRICVIGFAYIKGRFFRALPKSALCRQRFNAVRPDYNP